MLKEVYRIAQRLVRTLQPRMRCADLDLFVIRPSGHSGALHTVSRKDLEVTASGDDAEFLPVMSGDTDLMHGCGTLEETHIVDRLIEPAYTAQDCGIRHLGTLIRRAHHNDLTVLQVLGFFWGAAAGVIMAFAM